MSIYFFGKSKGRGSAIPVLFHISTYMKLGLLIQREKTKSERCTGKGLGRNMSTSEGIRLEMNEHFLRYSQLKNESLFKHIPSEVPLVNNCTWRKHSHSSF